MPIYEIESPDGRIFTIEGEKPPTEEELGQMYTRLFPVEKQISYPKLGENATLKDFMDQPQMYTDPTQTGVVRSVLPGVLQPEDLLPAVRKVGGEVVVGKEGDTHPDIIDREGIPAVDLDQRGFVGNDGRFYDREASAQGTGISTDLEPGRLHSTDLIRETEKPITEQLPGETSMWGQLPGEVFGLSEEGRRSLERVMQGRRQLGGLPAAGGMSPEQKAKYDEIERVYQYRHGLLPWGTDPARARSLLAQLEKEKAAAQAEIGIQSVGIFEPGRLGQPMTKQEEETLFGRGAAGKLAGAAQRNVQAIAESFVQPEAMPILPGVSRLRGMRPVAKVMGEAFIPGMATGAVGALARTAGHISEGDWESAAESGTEAVTTSLMLAMPVAAARINAAKARRYAAEFEEPVAKQLDRVQESLANIDKSDPEYAGLLKQQADLQNRLDLRETWEQEVLDAAKGTGRSIGITDESFGEGLIAKRNADGSISVNRDNLNRMLEIDAKSNPEMVGKTIKSLVNQEVIHAAIPNAEAGRYWRSLTKLEQSFEESLYPFEEGASDAIKGQEAIRRRIEMANGLVPLEFLIRVHGAQLRARAVDALLRALRSTRESLATGVEDAAKLKEQLDILNRAQQRIIDAQKGAPDALVTKATPVLRDVRQEPTAREGKMSEAERRAADDERRRQEGLGGKAQVPLEAGKVAPAVLPEGPPPAAPAEGKAGPGVAAPVEPAIRPTTIEAKKAQALSPEEELLQELREEREARTGEEPFAAREGKDIAKELGIVYLGTANGRDIYEFKHAKNTDQIAFPQGTGPEVIRNKMNEVLRRWADEPAASRQVAKFTDKEGKERQLEVQPGEWVITVQRPDGSTYEASFKGAYYENLPPEMAEIYGSSRLASIGRPTATGWSHGMLGKGEKIIAGEAGPSPVAEVPAAAREGLPPEIQTKFQQLEDLRVTRLAAYKANDATKMYEAEKAIQNLQADLFDWRSDHVPDAEERRRTAFALQMQVKAMAMAQQAIAFSTGKPSRPGGLPTTRRKYPKFDDFLAWAKRNAPGRIEESQVKDIWRDAVVKSVTTSTPKELGEWVKALDLAKDLGLGYDNEGNIIGIPDALEAKAEPGTPAPAAPPVTPEGKPVPTPAPFRLEKAVEGVKEPRRVKSRDLFLVEQMRKQADAFEAEANRIAEAEPERAKVLKQKAKDYRERAMALTPEVRKRAVGTEEAMETGETLYRRLEKYTGFKEKRGKIEKAVIEARLREIAPKADLDRKDFDMEEVDFGNRATVEGAWREITEKEAKNPEAVITIARDHARPSSKAPVSHTKRLLVVIDRATNAVEVLSTYNDGGTQMIVDPAQAGISARPNIPLDAQFLKKYRPYRAVLLKDAVQNFRKRYENLKEFEEKYENKKDRNKNAVDREKASAPGFAGEVRSKSGSRPLTQKELDDMARLYWWNELRGEEAKEIEGPIGVRQGGEFTGPEAQMARVAAGEIPGELERSEGTPLQLHEIDELRAWVLDEIANRGKRQIESRDDIEEALKSLVDRAKSKFTSAELAWLRRLQKWRASKPKVEPLKVGEVRTLREAGLTAPFWFLENAPTDLGLRGAHRTVISALQKISREIERSDPSVSPEEATRKVINEVYELFKASEVEISPGEILHSPYDFARYALWQFGERPRPPRTPPGLAAVEPRAKGVSREIWQTQLAPHRPLVRRPSPSRPTPVGPWGRPEAPLPPEMLSPEQRAWLEQQPRYKEAKLTAAGELIPGKEEKLEKISYAEAVPAGPFQRPTGKGKVVTYQTRPRPIGTRTPKFFLKAEGQRGDIWKPAEVEYGTPERIVTEEPAASRERFERDALKDFSDFMSPRPGLARNLRDPDRWTKFTELPDNLKDSLWKWVHENYPSMAPQPYWEIGESMKGIASKDKFDDILNALSASKDAWANLPYALAKDMAAWFDKMEGTGEGRLDRIYKLLEWQSDQRDKAIANDDLLTAIGFEARIAQITELRDELVSSKEISMPAAARQAPNMDKATADKLWALYSSDTDVSMDVIGLPERPSDRNVQDMLDLYARMPRNRWNLPPDVAQELHQYFARNENNANGRTARIQKGIRELNKFIKAGGAESEFAGMIVDQQTGLLNSLKAGMGYEAPFAAREVFRTAADELIRAKTTLAFALARRDVTREIPRMLDGVEHFNAKQAEEARNSLRITSGETKDKLGRQEARKLREAALAWHATIKPPDPKELKKAKRFAKRYNLPMPSSEAKPNPGLLNHNIGLAEEGMRKANALIRSGDPRNVWVGKRYLKAANRLRDAAIYARDHWESARLHDTGAQAMGELREQLANERKGGMSTQEWENYLPGLYEGETYHEGLFSFGAMRLFGRNFRQPKKFPNYYEAIAKGPYIPASFDVADIVANRIRRGNHVMARMEWAAALKGLVDPNSKKKVAVEPVMVQREVPKFDKDTGLKMVDEEGNPVTYTETGWTTPDANHTLVDTRTGHQGSYVSGSKPICVRLGYADMVGSLLTKSHIRQNAMGRGFLYATSFLKHNWVLMLDTFHPGRLSQYAAALAVGVWNKIIGKPAPGFGANYRGGYTALSYRAEDMQRAADAGLIPQSSVDWANGTIRVNIGKGRTIDMTRKQLLDEMVRRGLNAGRVADALYIEVGHRIPIIGEILKGTIGRYQKALFDHFVPGLIAESAVRNFEHFNAKYPDIPIERLARDINRDVNAIYGSLGRQGVFRNATLRDVLQIFLLAPLWREGLIQKELRYMARLPATLEYGGRKALRAMGLDISTSKNYTQRLLGREGLPPMGTLGGMMTRGLIGYFMLAQLINLITSYFRDGKGKYTWENEEEGHKMDAWLPFGRDGIWMPTMGVFGEITGDLIRLGETKPTTFERFMQVGLNSLGPMGKMADVLRMRETYRGERLTTTPRILQHAAAQVVGTTPISLTEPLRLAGHAVAPGLIAPGEPGMLYQRAMGSAGLKAVRGADPGRQIAQMAKKWAQKEKIPEPTSVFSPTEEASLQRFRHALRIGWEEGASKIYRELLDRYDRMPRGQGYENLSSEDMVARAMGVWAQHPYTGSRVKEDEFLSQLDGNGIALYNRAITERLEDYNRAIEFMMRQQAR